mgnify:CR=1 FL=1
MRIPLPRPGARSFIAIVFIVLAVAIIGVEHLAIHYGRKSIGRDAEQHLTAIADLKAQQVTSWIDERRAGAQVVGRGSLFADQIAQWLKRGAVEDNTAAAIKSRLATIAKAFRYRAVTLVDTQNRPLLSTHETPEINQEEDRAVAETIRTGDTVILDFHLSVDKSVRQPKIDILAPVYAGEIKSSPVAVLIFDIDPETSLHPLIESWPVPSVSAETLLVERRGNRVMYVTELRHQKDAQFKLHLPIDQADLVEAMGLRGQQGIVTGVDYRGVNVLAVSRPIPDSPWLMVAKVDSAEIYAPIQKLAGITASVTAIFVLAAALTTIAWLRARRDSEEKLRQANTELGARVQSRTTELGRSHQELQALIAVQESFQEEECKRIARELHDELAQKLTVLKLQIASIRSVVSAKEPGLARQIEDMNSLLTETIHAVGQIAANLRPVVLDELGLVTALRDLVEEFSQRTKVECELSVHPADLFVDNGLATPLYRMVQESLTNVARHAQATEVIVSLFRDASGTITLDINDNGKGFSNVDQSMRRSFGLIGMRERAAMLGGEMKVHSQPGAGTSIEIVIPRGSAQPQARAGGTDKLTARPEHRL